MTTVHVASKPRNNIQKCVRCGCVILNGQQQPVKFFPEDTLIAQTERENVAVVLDAITANYSLCDAGEFSDRVYSS